MKLGVLVSGNLGYIFLKDIFKKQIVVFVFTDSKSENIIQFCELNNIELFIGNPKSIDSKKFYSNKEIDVLVSVNYLFLIELDLIMLPKILSFNIHGSLLPKYRGRTPHVWAIINNEIKTGITAHIIDEGCDTGDILEQFEIEIGKKDTGADVLLKFNENYITLIDSVLKKIESNSLIRTKQNDKEATYFGKRTPEDGHVIWDWQKERIYNWIRAQAYPYPGAFTYFLKNKIIIDEIEMSNYGFDYSMPNGLIISVDPILVKTSNGVIKINKIRNNSNLNLKVGDILK